MNGTFRANIDRKRDHEMPMEAIAQRSPGSAVMSCIDSAAELAERVSQLHSVLLGSSQEPATGGQIKPPADGKLFAVADRALYVEDEIRAALEKLDRIGRALDL